MIRIDEIYNNVFLPLGSEAIQIKALHWFDPFGSTSFKDICDVPKMQSWQSSILFWDQEPVHRDRAKQFFDQFIPVYCKKGYSDLTVITSEYNSEDVHWLCDTYGLESWLLFFSCLGCT